MRGSSISGGLLIQDDQLVLLGGSSLRGRERLEGYGRGRETHGAGDLKGSRSPGLNESEDGLDTVLVVVGGLHLEKGEDYGRLEEGRVRWVKSVSGKLPYLEGELGGSRVDQIVGGNSTSRGQLK